MSTRAWILGGFSPEFAFKIAKEKIRKDRRIKNVLLI
jgi:hypothetical protein